ncbi:MAG: 5'/3'-nucleotidase SurE [bacterium]
MSDDQDTFILITNDDGLYAPGIRALQESLVRHWDTVVVAPDREQSASSHALTLHHPLRAHSQEEGWYAVDGTPTDCVMLGMHGLLDRKPTLVVSGINHGSNLGDDVIYSGTVAAAVEGTLLGCKSVAISLLPDEEENYDFRQAAEVAVDIVREVVERVEDPDFLLNVNVPPGPPGSAKGVRVCRLGRRIYREGIFHSTDPRGKPYYWIGGQDPTWMGGEETDFASIEEGYITLSPLRLDWTHDEGLARMEEWDISSGESGEGTS